MPTIDTSFAEDHPMEVSMGRRIAGWIITGLMAAFNLFDAFGKFARPQSVADAFVRTGWPLGLSTTLGVILLTSTLLYLVPRTSVLGAVLVTGYLGGAVATNLRLQNPLFSNTLFPVYFGILVWVGLLLREPRLKSIFPLVS
jgi:hypothetical protein